MLVGGGDPFLASRPAGDTAYPRRADVVTLARATARALRADGTPPGARWSTTTRSSPVRGSTRTGRTTTSPTGWSRPITALWVDEGRPATGLGRVADPPAAAAAAFAAALDRSGITVVGDPRPGRADADGGAAGAASSSAPLSRDRRAGPLGQRQRGRRGPRPPRRPRHRWQRQLRGRGTRRDPGPRRARGAAARRRGVRRQRPLPRGPPRAGHPARGAVARRVRASHPELRAVVTGLPVAGFIGLAGDPLRGRGAAGARPGAGQDRHAHRRQRAGRGGHRPATGTRWSSC